MNLASLGEDALVDRLTSRLRQNPEVQQGPGDDCAVVALEGASNLVLKTDAVVEGVHFHSGEDGKLVGRKALARCLSDFAATGAIPKWATVTLVCPSTLPVSWLDAFYTGLENLARLHGVSVVGGETSSTSGPFLASVGLSGPVGKNGPVLRSTARAGDAVWVTGVLGGSRAGHHLRFTPRLKESSWLLRHGPPTAMMDLSDGLGKDLPRLCRASGLGVGINFKTIPVRKGSSLRGAIQDGEDFELLFTWSSSQSDLLLRRWKKAFPRVRLTRIGVMTRSLGLPKQLAGGYGHFSVSQTVY
jgi:thiamine-monophosphate kinase